MKTHEFAKALTQFAKLLRSFPNQELEDFGYNLREMPSRATNNVGISLSALASLSKYSKSDWEKIASEFELPVEIRPRDAARDVMGKILTYLAENDAERERVAMRSQEKSDRPSELSNALQFLLSNG